ncbi:MAG: hypothetical protein GY822_25195 [Deltaproteobacteria bacterium]|nr:hypothetical protein [Deltaproteobacteria bacterium]
MKKGLILFVVFALLGGGYLAVAHLSGGAFSTLGLALGGERGVVRRMAMKFMEDIQFKDFERAASYHAPNLRESVDIPFLIWRLFRVKPEALDFMNYEVVLADMDKSELRARVKLRNRVKILIDGRIEEKEMMLYFERADKKSPWYMKLEDSLRQVKGDDDKIF